MRSESRIKPHVQSLNLERRAEEFFPGGVNSPVRAFRAVGGHPPFIERAEGATLFDADGNRYVDLFGSWGPMILGHAFPPVVEAIREAAGRGASFGASHAGEANLAELVQRCFPSVQKMRFVSSGTEACMSAIRLARGFTGRNFIIKFEGCYHGHADALLVKAGSGVATFGIPGSAGVPAETAQHTLALPYNNLSAVEAAFAAHPAQIACILVEPVVGNAGTIPPAPGYLAGLRRIATKHGALLIFDEVMTGFRLSLGGAQQLYNINSRPHHAGQGPRRRPALRGLRRTRRRDGPSARLSARSTRPERSAAIRWQWPPGLLRSLTSSSTRPKSIRSSNARPGRLRRESQSWRARPEFR